MRSSHLQDHPIAGKSLEPLLPPLHGNIAAVHQGNDLGYGKNAKDWIIRSQVLRESLWMLFNDYMVVGLGIITEA